MQIKGKVHIFGDNIDTDAIIPARYLNTSEPRELARHCMEDADPEFINQLAPGDIIVAGDNFGCGSSREHAPLAIKAAGVAAVIARTFARIFFRNALNIGLPILECPAAVDAVRANDELAIDLSEGQINNLTQGATFQAAPFPDFMRQLIDAGGLINYVKKNI